jgi:hypothetical protein
VAANKFAARENRQPALTELIVGEGRQLLLAAISIAGYCDCFLRGKTTIPSRNSGGNSLLSTHIAMQTHDFKTQWDETTVLRNPHKGWYHHYFDNGIHHYIPQSDDELENFPGLDHIYLRLAWSHLEPSYRRFNWKLIDDIIEKWTAKGLGISFRVTCKESGADQRYATPHWVKEAGAQGQYFSAWGQETWRPDYGDEIFLRYLEEFHAEFAARYDGKPWLEYVDIGSYGQWGEGHNWLCGEDDAPVEVLKKHVDIHAKHYKKSLLVVSDDITSRKDDKGPQLREYLIQNGVSFRDDSIGVRFYLDHYPHDSVRDPKLFEQVYRNRATVLELQHYHMMKAVEGDHSWRGKDGAEFGAQYFDHAIRSMRATFIGYHGHAREWLADNPNVTRKFANLCGYWFFLESASWPATAKAGAAIPLSLTWLNRGVAPAYRRYVLKLQLRDANGKIRHQQNLDDCDVTQWLPEKSAHENFEIALPKEFASGEYSMEIALRENESPNARPVLLALKSEPKTAENFYRLGTLKVE